MYTYQPVVWMLIFYVYCFLGWCFETAVVSIQQRRFVNRGFIRGPMLPLYGTGAVVILFVALPLRAHPVLLFICGMIAATLLEYVTGWAMETLFKVKYWDYSTHKLQYKGRICMQSSLAWGALSLLLVRLIHPPIETMITALPLWIAHVFNILISVFFAADTAYAFRTALDFAHVLEELTNLRGQMADIRAQLEDAAADTREKLTEKVQETREHLEEAALETREKWSDVMLETRKKREVVALEQRAKLQAALEELAASYEKRISKIGRTRRWLLRGNPSAVSEKFGEVLSELKEKFSQKQ